MAADDKTPPRQIRGVEIDLSRKVQGGYNGKPDTTTSERRPVSPPPPKKSS
jgi:hypothetical protein